MDSPWHAPAYGEQMTAIAVALGDVARELRLIREILVKMAGSNAE